MINLCKQQQRMHYNAFILLKFFVFHCGQWNVWHVLKTGRRESVSWVGISTHPPSFVTANLSLPPTIFFEFFSSSAIVSEKNPFWCFWKEDQGKKRWALYSLAPDTPLIKQPSKKSSFRKKVLEKAIVTGFLKGKHSGVLVGGEAPVEREILERAAYWESHLSFFPTCLSL